MYTPVVRPPGSERLRARPVAFTWLLCALALAILPHLPRMPLWVTLAVAGLGGYRILHDYQQWRLPPRWLTALLGPLAILGIVASFAVPTGRRAATAFLIVLMSLKLLETRSHRDVMVLNCIGFFLIITNFLSSQSIGMAIYLLAVVWLLTVTLIHFQHLGDVSWERLRVNARQGTLLLAQALPLMAVLFVFFPRVNGPLWSMPEDGSSGITGFSDEMSPGRIAELNASWATAFRVEFDGAVPPIEQQYWRGLVLWDFDGETWRQGERLPSRRLHWEHADTLYTYTITLEPHDRRWLFSLDLPYALVREGTVTPFSHTGHYAAFGSLSTDYHLRSIRPLTTITRYTLQSVATYHSGELDNAMRRRALQLPRTIHPQVQRLASSWRRESRADVEVVQQALRYFRDQFFVYTLTPPALADNPTYGFLFETRRGYCEHFASSFTVLMRAAGIPARVVIGYQGGEANPLGKHLTVRQNHAHAWSEVWLPAHGWKRIDPTSAVAPQRIEQGIESMPELSSTPSILRGSAWLHGLWRTVRLGSDALNYQWDRLILQYTAKRQTQLMARLGFGELTWRGLTVVLLGLLHVVLAVVALRMFRRRAPRDRIALMYTRFCRKLARRGIVRHTYEGPIAFARRVKHVRPELATPVDAITHLYGVLRYGRQQEEHDVLRLRHAVRTFKP